MSTRCLLGYKNEKTNMVKYCYCHFDGYPSGVGRILLDHYSHNNQRALELCSLKGISTLAPSLVETVYYQYTEREMCGEMPYDEWRTTDTFWADYVYTYDPWNGEWYVRPTFSYELSWISNEQEHQTITDPLERY